MNYLWQLNDYTCTRLFDTGLYSNSDVMIHDVATSPIWKSVIS